MNATAQQHGAKAGATGQEMARQNTDDTAEHRQQHGAKAGATGQEMARQNTEMECL